VKAVWRLCDGCAEALDRLSRTTSTTCNRVDKRRAPHQTKNINLIAQQMSCE
jgi:hypothetical protein